MERSFSGNEIVELFRKQCSPTVFGFCNKWFRDVELVGYMNTWLPGLSVLEMNRAFRREKSIAMCFDDVEKPNKYGFYRYRDTIKRERFTFYYISKDTTTLPVMLDDHQEWLEAAAKNVIRRSGRAKPTKRRNEESPGLREGTLNTSKQARNTSTPPAIKNTSTQQHEQPALQIVDSTTAMEMSPSHNNTNQVHVAAIQPAELGTNKVNVVHSRSLCIGFTALEDEPSGSLAQYQNVDEEAFFNSGRMSGLFAGKKNSPGSVKRNLERWIDILGKAPFSLETMQKVVNNADAFPLNHEQTSRVQLKVTYLHLSYKIALADMPYGHRWLDCIEEAVKKMEAVYGASVKRHPHTVARWHRYYRAFDCFPHPNYQVQIGKEASPYIFVHLPEAKEKFECWAKENLSTLTTESALVYLKNTLIPEMYAMVTQECIDNNARPLSNEDFLASLKLSTISHSTAWRCIAAAGLVFKEHTKTYFTDRHESAENVAHRADFVKRYFKWEELSYRWVQLPVEEAIKLENEGDAGNEKLLPDSFVFEYTDATTGT